ncbi:MAG: glycosyltransferase family 2 protein [Planctomycetes bacterium]|nr:glycosyltransferase family 2 protein [Planctomycetota bacterium]
MMRLSVIVLSWNTRELLRACLRALDRNGSTIPCEIIVVDNASCDGSPKMVAEEFPETILIQNARNEGYARGNNIGIRRATGDYLLLLNSDTEVREKALDTMIDFLELHPGYGACGAQLLNPDGTIQRACMRFPGLIVTLFFDTFLERLFPQNAWVHQYFMRDFDHASSRDVDQPPGACFMIRRSLVEEIGLLDEDLFLFYNDVDYCLRIRKAGYDIRFLADARVLHHGGASTRHYRDFGLEWHKNRVRYYRKHFGFRGALATKAAAVTKALELILRGWKSGSGLRSPETRQVMETLRTVLKT